ncbi:MAG: hypothetical protein SFX73_36455 [Kofleriaceae bacterium]|nr:hypothetical protein [Kofleriaceae bacterium]
MRLPELVVGALLVVPMWAAAETPVAPVVPAPGGLDVSPPDVNDLVFARQEVPDEPTPMAAGALRVAKSRVIYLNRNGITVSPGTNDARSDRTTIAKQATTFGPWTAPEDVWSKTVTCVRDMFSRWDVQITEEDPGDVAHIEAVFGGRPSQLGLTPNTAGVAPFTTSCGIIENAIVFAFTDILPDDPQMTCEIISQEIAHAYGLDHEMLPADPMTYLDYDGNRTFQDVDAACGEKAERPCGINGSTCRATQNSVALLTERLGARDGSVGEDDGTSKVPPGSSISSPLDEEGGCSTGGGASLFAGLGLLGLVGLRSRGLQRRRAHR